MGNSEDPRASRHVVDTWSFLVYISLKIIVRSHTTLMRPAGSLTQPRLPVATRSLLTIIALATLASTALSQDWEPLGEGLDGPVYCLAVYKNQLYAGGAFQTAGGAPAANIARWNGTGWSALGSGTDNAVHALFVEGGYLYVGGSFTSCGGVSCSHVARWDSSSWSPVGSGLNGPVFSIVAYNGMLFIGGDFSKVGTNPVNRIAAWDGNTWRDVSGGVENTVHALHVTASSDLFADLYAGGDFVGQGLAGVAWYHPAYGAWRATEWGGYNATVYAFANYSGGPVVGGSFSSTGTGFGVNHLALRGYAFQGGVNGVVYALLSEGNSLYVGGSFSTVGPVPEIDASNIAVWNGTFWEALGSGMNDTVRTMVMFQGHLHAGGDFDGTAGTHVNHVARWGAVTDVKPVSEVLAVSGTLLQNYPNPFNPSTVVRYQVQGAGKIKLAVYDLTGHEVTVLVNGRREAGVHTVVFDGSRLAAGVYICRLQTGTFTQSRKLVLLR
jgi:hypothetical protein